MKRRYICNKLVKNFDYMLAELKHRVLLLAAL